MEQVEQMEQGRKLAVLSWQVAVGNQGQRGGAAASKAAPQNHVVSDLFRHPIVIRNGNSTHCSR